MTGSKRARRRHRRARHGCGCCWLCDGRPRHTARTTQRHTWQRIEEGATPTQRGWTAHMPTTPPHGSIHTSAIALDRGYMNPDHQHTHTATTTDHHTPPSK